MKRTFIIAVFSMVLAFSACTDPNQTDYDIQKEALTAKQGWILTKATSSPGYPLFNGDVITDLFQGFIWQSEVDDIWYFDATGAQFLDPSKILGEGQSSGKISLGNWKLFSEKDASGYFPISFQLPWFYAGTDANPVYNPLTGTLIKVDNKELKINVTPDVKDPNPAKVKYTFSLTFKRN